MRGVAGTLRRCGPLVGRSDDLAALDEQVGKQAGSVVLVGPLGVGKSRLLATWVSAWEAGAGEAIVVRATRSTATIPFGAFAGWVPSGLGGADDRLAVLQATAARLAGAGGPLAVAVDDAHLLDEGSAALVLHLVQHIPLRVLLTVRSGEPCPDAVVALWKEGLASRLELRPLSELDAADLLAHVLGDSVDPAARQRVWQLSQGNPMYLGEVVDAARAQDVLVRADGVWQWQGGLTGRTRLVELVSDRIGAAGSAERRVLEIVALGEPLAVEVLARLADQDLLAAVESQGLVVVELLSSNEPGQAVRLAHPLYSEVLRAELPAFTARSHHAALAEAALAAGLHRRDPLRVATWLLDSGDEPTEPELLLRASVRARLADDYELSVRFAEAAERAGGGWQATLRRAIALGPLRRLEEADVLLASLSQPGADPEAHVAAARVRAEQSFWHRGDDLTVARAIVAEAAEVLSAPERSSLLAEGVQLTMNALDLDAMIELATRVYTDASSLVDRLHGITGAGLAAAFLGRTSAALAAVDMARPGALEVLGDDPIPALHAALTYSFASVLDGRIDEAAAFFEQIHNQNLMHDGGPPEALPTYWCARAALAQGRVATAARLCREALGLLGDGNHYGRGTWVANTLAIAAAQSGDVAAAAAAIDWVTAHRTVSVEADDHGTELARAWLAAARGELSTARESALATARRAAAVGAWMLETITLLDVARLGAAGAAAPRLEELTRVVEGPYVVAAACFARAAALPDGPGLDDAAARFAAMGARLHAAEAATAAAEAHAADGQRRRQAVSRANAQELAARCEGAVTPLLARLDHQPLVTTLTDREREVAQLATRGRTSRQIAEALTISQRTVHSHLNHAYAKLGISDRGELATLLGTAVGSTRTRRRA
jgi:DNA-binding CsgD family transcriptional regulator